MLTYEQLADLMLDPQFRGRIKVACLKYATYVINAPGSAPLSMQRWAQSAFIAPDQAAQQVQSPVVMDAAVMDKGNDIADDQLQTAVETVVKKMQ